MHYCQEKFQKPGHHNNIPFQLTKFKGSQTEGLYFNHYNYGSQYRSVVAVQQTHVNIK